MEEIASVSHERRCEVLKLETGVGNCLADIRGRYSNKAGSHKSNQVPIHKTKQVLLIEILEEYKSS